jgi:hypothetical protein
VGKHRAELATMGRHRQDEPSRTAMTRITIRTVGVFAIVAFTAPFLASPAAADPASSWEEDSGYASTWGESDDSGFGRGGTRIG